MAKMGSICHFLRALPASIWGHCSQVLVFTSIWAHKKGCDNDTFRAVFPQCNEFLERQKARKPQKAQGKDSLTYFCAPLFLEDSCFFLWRAELQVTKLNGTNRFLRNSAVSCVNLRFPAVFCEDPRLRNAVIPQENLGGPS